MENLEARKKIINLGKLFVKELKLEPGVDTFSRWMVHYIAEKINLAENAKGKEHEIVEKEIFDIILKLWNHRHTLPSGNRPLENFEPILDLLVKLNPESEEPFFYNAILDQDSSTPKKNDLDSDSVNDWVNIIRDIDKVARIWIDFALEQAANKAINERTKEWLENACGTDDNTDIEAIRLIIENRSISYTEDNDEDDFSKKYDIQRLNERISQLQKFSKFNETLLKVYEAELEKYKSK